MSEENIPQTPPEAPDAPLPIDEAKRVIEAVLFASGEPVSYATLAETLGYKRELTERLVAEMEYMYDRHGIMLARLGECCQLVTREEYVGYIRQALNIRVGGSLSNAALEVLAITAYHQPVTKAYIEQIRGTDSAYALSSLCDRGLIEVCGKLDVVGKPNLYRTTSDFLRSFGLATLGELPALEL